MKRVAVTVAVLLAGLAVPAAAPAALISGTVTNGSAPLAEVCVSALDASLAFRGPPVVQQTTDFAGQYVLDVPAGQYKVQFEHCPLSGSKLWASEYFNNAYVWWNAAVLDATAGDVPNVHAALVPGHTISGHVTNPEAVGLQNICAQAFDASAPDPSGHVGDGAGTDSGGDYVLPPLPYGTYKVEFRDCNAVPLYVGRWYNQQPNYQSATPVDNTSASPTGIDAVLEVGRTVSGTVTNGGGQGLSGICVNLSTPGPSPGPQYGTQTGPTGSYTTAPAPPGTYTLRFDDCNPTKLYVGEYYNDRTRLDQADPVDLTGGSLTGLDAVLATGHTISGRVTSDGANPISGICVWPFDASSPSAPSIGNANTDAGGYYTAGPLPPGTYKLQFRDCNPAPTWVPEWFNDKYDQMSADAVVVAGVDLTGMDAVLQPGHTISGHVSGPGAMPLQNICVWAFDMSKPMGTPSIGMTGTDSSGNYTTNPVPAGNYRVQFSDCTPPQSYLTEYWNNRTDPAQADPVVVAGSNVAGIDAVMDPGHTISGQVTGTGGVPLQGICVGVFPPTPGTPQISWGNTDASGNYTSMALPPGTYKVGFMDCRSTPSYIGEWYDDKPDQVQADPVVISSADVTAIDAQLTQGYTFTGRITDEGANPVQGGCAGAWTEASGGEGEWSYGTFADASGNYRLGPMLPGNYYVSFGDCSPPNDHFQEWYDDSPTLGGATAVNPSLTPVLGDAVLETGYVISGHVTNPGGTGVANVCVNVNDANSDPENPTMVAFGQTDSGGDYSAGPLRSGDYKVAFNDCNPDPPGYVGEWYADADDFGTANTLTLAGANIYGVNAQLALGYTISGIVTSDDSGLPLENICVSVVDADDPERWIGGGQTQADGSYETGPLRPGAYKVGFDDCGSGQYIREYYNDVRDWDAAQPIAITGSDVTGISAGLESGYTIAGTVTSGATGLPIANVCVEVTGADNEDSWFGGGYTEASGDYRTDALPPGSYKIGFRDCNDPATYVFEWFDGAGGTRDWGQAEPVEIVASDVTGIGAALATGYKISGTVTADAGGAPLAQICVDATSNAYPDLPGFNGYTGPDGSYTTEPMPPGSYTVYFSDCGQSPVYVSEIYDDTRDWEQADPVVVTSSNRTGIDAGLASGHSVSGTVIDAGTSNGIGNVCLGLVDDTDPDAWVGGAETNPDGTYTVEPVPPGLYKLQFSDCEYPTRYVWEWFDDEPSWEAATLVDLRFENQTANATLARGGSISGTVRAGSGGGAPLADMCVNAENATGYGNGTMTQPDGTYILGGLPTGAYTVSFEDCRSDQSAGTYHPLQLTGVGVTAPGDTPGVNANMGLPDNTWPDTFITSGPTGTTDRTSAAFTFASDDPEASFQCMLDAGQWADCTSPASHSGLTDGLHTFRVKAIDPVGHVDEVDPATHNWVIDTTTPLTSHGYGGVLPAGGGTVTSDPFGTGATASDPVKTAVTAPGGGFVDILEGPATGAPPAGFVFFGQQVQVASDVQATAADPFRLEFTLDSSLIPAGTVPVDIQAFRDGTRVLDCTALVFADPDPCVLSRELLAGGDVRITILSSQTSVWSFGIAAARTVSIGDATPVTEGDAGTVDATFSVTLSATSPHQVSVGYATVDGSAGAPADYSATSGTLVFDPGQTSKPVTVAVKGDLLAESDETFTVHLSSPVNASIADSDGTGTITDDDQPPTISAVPTVADLTATSATLGGTINPRFSAATYHIDYGPTTGYGSQMPAFGDAYVGSDGTGHPVAQAVSGLAEGVIYHFRLVATNDAGTVNGPDNVFATLPAVPGKPSTSAAITTGALTVGWPAGAGALSYTLAFKDADDAGWTQVAAGVTSPTYPYAAAAPEGTLSFRVKAIGPLGGESAYSAVSDAVIVDRTAPAAPVAAADRLPEYGGDGGWYRDRVTVFFAGGGDTGPDGPGSGVDPASVPAAQTFTTTGAHTVTGTVRDRAGNVSGAATLTVKVDADAPSTAISCPVSVNQNTAATAHWTAADAGSGLATAGAGDVALDTSTLGTRQTAAPAANDRVGHATPGATCTYTVASGAVLPAISPKVAIATTRVRATRAGYISFRLTCKYAACAGTFSLKATVRVAGRRKTVKLGAKKYSIAKNGSKIVKLRLSKSNRALLKKLKRIRATATATITAGKGPTARRTVTISRNS